MKRYTVTGPAVTVSRGIVGLSEKQAKRRRINLKRLDTPGQYLVTSPTAFKHGEEFEWDGDPSRAMVTSVESEAPEGKGTESVETCPNCNAPRSDFNSPQAWGGHKKKCKPEGAQ